MAFTDGLTEAEVIDWMTSYLKKRGFRVIGPEVERDDAIRITGWDPKTGEILDVRYVDPR